MDHDNFNNWEEGVQEDGIVQEDKRMNLTVRDDLSRCSSCDAWGSRIEAILLADLAEEEWQALVEHVQTCSACAELFWRYQWIKEIARKASGSCLYDREYEQMTRDMTNRRKAQ